MGQSTKIHISNLLNMDTNGGIQNPIDGPDVTQLYSILHLAVEVL